MEMQELRELVEFLKKNGIAEFELDRGEQHVKLKFESAFVAAAAPVHYAAAPTFAAPTTGALQAAPQAIAAEPAAAAEEALHTVKSPIVGTFYESAAPGVAAFVKVGDTVEVGQVLCIVEAMKLMNEIESDVAGEVVKLIAKNGAPVEYGQPLFAVRAK